MAEETPPDTMDPEQLRRRDGCQLIESGASVCGQFAPRDPAQRRRVVGVGPKAIRILRTELAARGSAFADEQPARTGTGGLSGTGGHPTG